MVKCSFSGEEITPGTGIMYIKKDGTILYFKNSKCKKNMLHLKRKPYNVKWTKSKTKKSTKATEPKKEKKWAKNKV
ncbi:MAG: 50S ribosomal protein L24e [Nanoarchaeota archaeon]|nr:50S ribosomal protein L24e [Nanoarchaeota archaeon]